MSDNQVEIDPARLEAEADAALASAPVESQPAEVAPAESWGPFLEGLLPTLRGIVFAQWQIHPTQLKELQDSLTVCLDQVFPGGMAGPYACWVRLATCCTGIGITNFIANGGTLPPLGLPRAAKEKEPATGIDASTAH